MAIRASSVVRALARWWFGSALVCATGDLLERADRLAREMRLRRRLGACGSNVSLQFPICVAHPERVHLGNDVSIAAFVHVWGLGGVHVGDRVMIASHVALTTITHDPASGAMWQTVDARPVRVGDDAWIGAHAVILPGITIGRGAVVGAGSVVTADVPDYAVVLGAPARVHRYREGFSAPRS